MLKKPRLYTPGPTPLHPAVQEAAAGVEGVFQVGQVRVRRSGKHQYYVLNEGAFGFCSPRSACRRCGGSCASRRLRRG